MKIKIIIISICSLVIFIINSCKLSIKDKDSEYKTNIYRWFSKNVDYLDFIESQWILYFDDLLTCKTCKLDILSKIKSNDEIVVITRFSEDLDVKIFKETYSLTNLIINIEPDTSENLNVPFLFLKEDRTMKNLIILNDEKLETGEWWTIIN